MQQAKLYFITLQNNKNDANINEINVHEFMSTH